MRCLSPNIADEINYITESLNEHQACGSWTLSDTRQARQKILNAINRNVLKFEKREDEFKDSLVKA